MLSSLTPLAPELVRLAAVAGANAFADDPSTLYLIPNPKNRQKLYHAFEYCLRLSLLDHSETHLTSAGCEGLAIWVHSNSKSSFVNNIRAGWPWNLLRCGLTYLIRDLSLQRRYEALRREIMPEPHLYLALLAVAPKFQGQGLASKLVRPMLSRLDTEQLPAYLETQNLKNVAMYERYGFQLFRTDAVPRANFTMYLMVRRPAITS